MKDVADTQRTIEAAVTTEPEKAAQEPDRSLGGRIVDEAGGQLLVDVVSALVQGAPKAAADCAEVVAGAAGVVTDAAGAVAGAVADGLGSL